MTFVLLWIPLLGLLFTISRGQTCSSVAAITSSDRLQACPSVCDAVCTAPDPTQNGTFPATTTYTQPWQSIGRVLLQNNNGRGVSFAGRTNGVVHHYNYTTDIVYTANAGGLWRTLNWSANAPVWEPLSDQLLMGIPRVGGGLIDDGRFYNTTNAATQPRSVYLYLIDSAAEGVQPRGSRGLYRYDMRSAAWSPSAAEGVSYPKSTYWATQQGGNLALLPSVQETGFNEVFVIPNATTADGEDDVVLVGTNWGVLRSQDSGATWNYSNAGLDIGTSGYLGDLDETATTAVRVKPVPSVKSLTYDWANKVVYLVAIYNRYPFQTNGQYRQERAGASQVGEWTQIFQSNDSGRTWQTVNTSVGSNDLFYTDRTRQSVTLLRNNAYPNMEPYVVGNSSFTGGFYPRIGDLVETRLNSSGAAPVFRGRITGLSPEPGVADGLRIQFEQVPLAQGTVLLVAATALVDFYRLSRLSMVRVMFWEDQLYCLVGTDLTSVLGQLRLSAPLFTTSTRATYHGRFLAESAAARGVWVLNTTSPGSNQWSNTHMLDVSDVFTGGTPTTTMVDVGAQLQYDSIMYAYQSATNAAEYGMCIGGIVMICTTVPSGQVWSTQPWNRMGGVGVATSEGATAQHVDIHSIGQIRALDGVQDLVVGTDGGIYWKNRTNNDGVSDKNLNIQTLECFSVTSSPQRENTTRAFYLGTQDNGIIWMNTSGYFTAATGGDGYSLWLSQAQPEQGVVAIINSNQFLGRRNTTILPGTGFNAMPNYIAGDPGDSWYNQGLKSILTPTPQQDPSGTQFYVWNFMLIQRHAINTSTVDQGRAVSVWNQILVDAETVGTGIGHLNQSGSTSTTAPVQPLSQWVFGDRIHTSLMHNIAIWRSTNQVCIVGDPIIFAMDQQGQVFARAPSCRRSGPALSTALSNSWTYQGVVTRTTVRDLYTTIGVSVEGVLFAGNQDPLNDGSSALVSASFDFGQSWTNRSSGLCDTTQARTGCAVYHLVGDPWRPHTMYAATKHGVFWTQDNGQLWRRFGAGLPVVVPTTTLYPYPSGASMIVSTFGRGAWQIQLPGGALPLFNSTLSNPQAQNPDPAATTPGTPYPPGPVNTTTALPFMRALSASIVPNEVSGGNDVTAINRRLPPVTA